MYEQISPCGNQYRIGWHQEKHLWFIEQLEFSNYKKIGWEPDHSSAILRIKSLCQGATMSKNEMIKFVEDQTNKGTPRNKAIQNLALFLEDPEPELRNELWFQQVVGGG